MSDTVKAQRDNLLLALKSLFERLHASALEPEDVILPHDEHLIEPGIQPAVVAGWLESGMVHAQDVLPFKHLSDSEAVVLDVGAHTGYTAASLRNLPLSCWIHSFEPNTAYNPMLSSLRAADPKYGFSNLALSDENNTVRAYNVVINGTVVGGTASIAGATFEPQFAEFLAHFSTRKDWLPLQDVNTVKLLPLDFETRVLDDLVYKPCDDWPHLGRRIIGLKIDVEGHEFSMLRGCERVLAEHRPLVMVECQPRLQAELELLLPNYLPCERVADYLMPTQRPPHERHYNAYFVHERELDEFVACGLIRRQ